MEDRRQLMFGINSCFVWYIKDIMLGVLIIMENLSSSYFWKWEMEDQRQFMFGILVALFDFSCWGVLIIMENLSSSYFLISTASELTVNLLQEHFSGVAGELSSCLSWGPLCFSSLSPPPLSSSFYGSAAVSQRLLPSPQTWKAVMHYPTIPM